MPGRYADQLRRITRKQSDQRAVPTESGTPAQPPRPRSPYAPFLIAGVIVALVGVGWLLMQQMTADSKLQDCVMSGRKNCVPLEETAPGR